MLKRLVLHGFKSFADKTAFDFSPGITGVVGPNGSGKSNVVDSIKWILGDQSASSLRGKSMSDVIFNGSSSRSGSPFAEATLVFDNTSGFLPSEMTEVSVGRRLWRSGDSEYLINGEVARLRDVRNLFMGTGAGASSYCIIEQGRVAQILQTNAASRRLVFEEAAGVSRYKQRRAEALRKLERVEQHVTRLSDIVEEAESRLSAVRTQAARAARYRELRTEYERLWVGLAADEYRRLSARRELLAEEITELNRAIAEITGDQERLEEERERTEEELSRVEEQLRSLERQRTGLQSRIASLRTTISHEHGRLDETLADLLGLRAQSSLLTSRTREAADQLLDAGAALTQDEQRLHELQRQLQQAQEEYQAFEARILESQKSLESDRNRLMEQVQKNSSLDSQLSTVRSSLDQTAEEIAKLDEDRQTLDQQVAESRAEAERRQQQVESLETELTAADEDVQSLRRQRDEAVQRHADAGQRLADLRGEQAKREARVSVLEELERRQEGLRIGTREILKRAESADREPWTSIIGSVTDLMEVDLDKAALLEVALADRAQLIVIREMDTMIEYINSGRCRLEGRVGFVALQDINNSEFLSSPWRPADADLPDLRGEPGVLCPAAELATCSEHAPRLARHLLGDTWIVETLNDAILLSDQTHRRCRFVTLQGELVDSDGTLFAGIELSASAVLTRRSELRRLRAELQAMEHEFARAAAAEQEGTTEVESAEAALQAAIERVRARSEELTRLRIELGQVQETVARLQQQVDELTSKKATLVEQSGLLAQDLKKLRAFLEAGTAQIEVLKQRLKDAEHTLTTARQQQEALTADRNRAEVALGKQEERIAALRETLERLRVEVDQRRMQEAEAERRTAAAVARQSEISLRILNATSEHAGLSLRCEATLAGVRKLASDERRLKTARAGVAAREARLAGQRRDLATRHHALEMETGTLTHQLQSTQERIEDELEVSLLEAVRSGVSAMAAHVIPTLTHPGSSISETEPVEAGQEPADQTDPADKSETGARAVPGETADPQPQDGAAAEFEAADSEGSSDGEDQSASGQDSNPGGQASQADEAAEASAATAVTQRHLTAVEQMDDEEFERLRAELDERVERLRRRLRNMGSVSAESLENLDEIEGRFGRLSHQLQDLVQARDTLEAIVRRINAESKRMFAETFESIRGHFQDLFRKLFGGGEGDVILEDPDDVLECGIDIVARPPGKELRSISLLSGGEKTMTAVALLLAIFRSRPSPFCILDEVDAALDEANVDRFVQVLREFQETTQFIMITHRKPSMTVCDLIFGVTMEESGVSKRLTVRFDDVNENGEFVTPAENDQAA